MNTLMLFKHIKERIVVAKYFRSEDKAIQAWGRIPHSGEWEVIYLEERKPSGHRYQLTYTKKGVLDNLDSKDIICFSKKEALYLKNKIERINQHYNIQIEKLY